MLADEIVVKNIFKDEKCLSIEDIKDLVNDKDEIKTSIKAKEYIVSVINANENKFNSNNYGECWGKVDKGYGNTSYIYTFNAQILFSELGRGGFEFDTIKKEWADMGFLELNSQGRFIHQTSIDKVKGNFVKLKLEIID